MAYKDIVTLENDPVRIVTGSYLQNLADHQDEPGILIESELLEPEVEARGAKAFSVAEPIEPDQIMLPLYIGFTSPRAKSEIPHWHYSQAESYVVNSGEAVILAKHRWNREWEMRVARAGSIVIIQPEVCHWFQWRSKHGIAFVFKAPQVPGIGRPPAGKSICNSCPHYQTRCILPDGFTP